MNTHDPRSLGPERVTAKAEEMAASGISPEEYAGRHGAGILEFGMDRYRFPSAATTAWIDRLAEILASPERVRQCQERYLPPDELARVRRLAEEEWLSS